MLTAMPQGSAISWRKSIKGIVLFLICLCCASCARHHGHNGFEPQINVKGQYDASFGLVR